MRCWHPRASKIINECSDCLDPDEVVLDAFISTIFSGSTSGSSIKEWEDICKINNYKVKTSIICCYPTDKNFIKAHTT